MLYENHMVIDLEPRFMNADDFFRFCQQNKHLHIERDADGKIHAMAPTGFETGKRNTELITELNLWNRQHRLG